jgi:hypothetical protein
MLVENEYGEFEVIMERNWLSTIDYVVEKLSGEWPPREEAILMCNKYAINGTCSDGERYRFISAWFD